jgi:hypothetical protein
MGLDGNWMLIDMLLKHQPVYTVYRDDGKQHET